MDRHLQSDNDESKQGHVERIAVRRAEATVYALNNAYLDIPQKAFVEAWFQTPSTIFGLTILTAPVWSSGSTIVHQVLVAAVVSACIALVFLIAPNRWLVFGFGIFMTGWHGMILLLCFAAYCFFIGRWGYGLFGIIASTGVVAVAAPGLWIYTIFGSCASGTTMHPKYAIAKRVFGVHYPFEQ